MRKLLAFVRRHWGKAVLSFVVIGGVVAYAASPLLRTKSRSAWQAALTWAGITEGSVDAGKLFWCPMDPQIRNTKENAICPICNMALVELEGGGSVSSQQLALTSQQVQQAGVVTEPVMRRKFYREINTTGRIDYDERQLAKITSWVRGKSRIEKLFVNYRGMHVALGQPVAELYSPELLVAQQEYVTALQTPSRSSAGGLKDGLLKAARQKLKYQGLSDAQIDELTESRQPRDSITILAPAHGTVQKVNVRQGQYVTEGEVLFELVSLSQLWVFADIFEGELPLVKLGMPVEVSVQSLPGEVFHGEISFIDHMLKPGTRTIPIRADAENKDHRLKVGMFARVRLRRDWPSLLAVPENAVLWSGHRTVVMVRMGEGTFQPREVELGRKWLFAADDGNTAIASLGFGSSRMRYHEVLTGLTLGDQVVTAGAFLLNAESQFRSVLVKMLPPVSQRVTLEQLVGPAVANRIRGVLDVYFKLSESLADDKLEEVPSRLKALADETRALTESASEADAGNLKAEARRFHELVVSLCAETPKDAHDARTRFGRISHELTKFLDANGGKILFGTDLYQFECGMAKVGYERWLWWSPEIHNPYMGQRMLLCGKKLDAFEP